MTRRALVIGAAGFLGNRIARTLAKANIDVIAAVRRESGVLLGGHQQVIGSFDSPNQLRPLIAISDLVIHTASTSTPATSSGSPLSEVDSNLRVTAALLEAMQDSPRTPLIYLSSGGSIYAENPPAPSSESAATRPRSYHGAVKLAAEWLISAWCDQYNSRAIAVRPSNIYGPGQPERHGFGIIPAAFGCISRGEPLRIWGDGTSTRDYVYVDDVAQLVCLAANSDLPVGFSTVNACNGTSVSLNTLLDVVEEVTGQRLSRDYQSSRAVDASHIAMSNTRAFECFGWEPRVSLRDGIEAAWMAYKVQQTGGLLR